MNTKTTLPITEARKQIFKITDEVQKPGNYYTLTEKGRPKAVVMSNVEFDSLMETMEILSDPGAMARIKKAEEEFKKGKYSSWDEVKKELGWDRLSSSTIREKAKNVYGSKSKRRKK